MPPRKPCVIPSHTSQSGVDARGDGALDKSLGVVQKHFVIPNVDTDSVPFTNRVNVEAPVTSKPLRVNGSAYYAKQNLLIVPATDWCAEFNKDTTAPDPEIRSHVRLLLTAPS
jgi:hypothetical protein